MSTIFQKQRQAFISTLKLLALTLILCCSWNNQDIESLPHLWPNHGSLHWWQVRWLKGWNKPTSIFHSTSWNACSRGNWCLNLHGEAGILGSLSNALVTDSRWKCTGRGKRYRIKGKYWTKALFDDSDWPQAVEYFPNRGWTYWGNMSAISDKAFWIWSADKGKHAEVYCRRRVSDFSVRHRKRGLLKT